MNIKQKVKMLVFGALMVMGASAAAISPSYADCGGVTTSIINCSQGGNSKCPDGSTPDKDTGACSDGSNAKAINNNGVWGVLLLVINILTAGIGIAAVGGIVYGSALYASSGGDAEGVKKAKGVITNVVIGLVAYALMYSLLNFIIPGGLFN